MDNNKIRRAILEILYERFEEVPYSFVSREELLKKLYWPKSLNSNIFYLEEKGYVKSQKPFGTPFIAARIKADGIDLIENESEFNVKFPIRQNITHIEGDMVGVVSQGDKAQISSQVSIQIGENFNNILLEIDSSKGFDAETKRLLKNKVLEIKAEIQKPEPEGSKVKSALDFLRSKAKWVYDKIVMNPVIAPVLLEVAKRHFFGG